MFARVAQRILAITAAAADCVHAQVLAPASSPGVPDAADLGPDRAAAAVERIVAAVGVPVSADIEAGTVRGRTPSRPRSPPSSRPVRSG